MTKIFYFVLLVSSIILATSLPIRSQVVNDVCETAIEIVGVVADSAFVCIQGTTLGALPEIIDNDCSIGQFPSVWYKIHMPAESTIANIQVTSEQFDSPTISLFYTNGICSGLIPVPLTQSNFSCIVGTCGQAEAIANDVGAHENYFIVVGSVNSIGGDFELCINTISVSSPCATNSNIEITSRSADGPLTGPFYGGETIGVCLNVNNYSGVESVCQWFQGIVPVFGNAWDPASFDCNGQPLNATVNGQQMGVDSNGVYFSSTWDWFINVGHHDTVDYFQVGDFDGNGSVDMCNNRYDPDCPNLGGVDGGCCPPCWDNPGGPLPPGWFAYGMNGSCQTPGPPVWLDWGDGNSCGPVSGPWKFCFDLKIREFPDCVDNNCDLSIGFFTFSDGQTGAVTGPPSICALDQPAKITIPFCCRLMEEQNEVLDPICSGQILNYLLDENGVDFWTWTVDTGNVLGANDGQSGPGTVLMDTLFNPTSDVESVLYAFIGYGDGPCMIIQKRVLIDVYPELIVIPDTIVLCGIPLTYILTAEVSGGFGTYEYSWLESGETTPSIEVQNPSNETIRTVTVTDGGCIDTAVYAFAIQPSFPVIINAPVTSQCEQAGPFTLESVANGGIAPFTYNWILPNGTIIPGDSITSNMSGLFIALVTDQNDCTGRDSVITTLFDDPEVSLFTSTGGFELCEGSTMEIAAYVDGGQAPYSYQWNSDTVSSEMILITLPGVYSVTVEDANGCTAISQSVSITVIQSPVVDLGPDTLILDMGDLLDAGNEGATFIWNTGDTTQTIEVNLPGHYQVTVTASNGCTASDQIAVELSTQISHPETGEFVKIFPNPTQGEFTISGLYHADIALSITILNSTGGIIYKEDLQSANAFSKKINLAQAAPGVYFVKIDFRKRQWLTKLIVE